MDVTFSDGTTERYEDEAIAQGAMGSVYRSTDHQHVFKLYTGLTPAELAERSRVIDLIIGQYNPTRNAPGLDELYAWPDKRAISPGLGVRMRNITGLTRMDNFFYRKAYQRLNEAQRGSWMGRVAVAIKLARAVNQLMRAGLRHPLLDDMNILVDPAGGRMVLLNCDDLVVPGVLPPNVVGHSRYMAPELVSHRMRDPSVVTDRHAMAVLLYCWLLYRHPLIGPKLHDPNDPDRDEALMLGERALYIAHPTDRSNRPDPMLITADALTPRLRDLFQRAFVDGLHTPTKRPLPNFWEEALAEMYDRLIPCPNPDCEWKFFPAPESSSLRCPVCQTAIREPGRVPYLLLESPQRGSQRRPQRDPSGGRLVEEGRYPRYVVGWPGRSLHAWHADPDISPGSPSSGQHAAGARPLAIIRLGASRRDWYLENVRLPEMTLESPTTNTPQWTPIPIGGTIPLDHAMRLHLGQPGVARMMTVEMRNTQ